MPPSPSSGCIITPECAAAPPASAIIGCEKRSRITSSPGRVCRRIAIWLHIVPLGRNSAASWPSSSATRSWRALTVGSSPRCSSATSAVAIARRMPSLGFVWVSERRLMLTRSAYDPRVELSCRIGLGCMSLSVEGRPPEERAIQVIHTALEAGVELLDTADAYALGEGDFGHGERLIAKALKGRRRDGVVVGTKGGHTRVGTRWELDGRPEYLKRACEASLRRLE